MIYEFTVPNRAVPLTRPRINMSKVFGRSKGPLVYTPYKCKKYQKLVADCFKKAYPDAVFLNHPIRAVIQFRIKTPGTPSKFAHRPDIDNYLKSVLDGLDGVAYEDDAFVTSVTAEKFYVDTKDEELTVIRLWSNPWRGQTS